MKGISTAALPIRFRVLLVVGSVPPVYAGGGIRFSRYGKRLAARGELAFLLTHTYQGPIPEDFRPELDEEAIVRLPLKPIARRKGAGNVGKMLWFVSLFLQVGLLLLRRRSEYNIVHVTGANWLCLFALFWAKMLGRKGVFEISLFGEDDPTTLKNAKRSLRYRLFRCARAYVALSPQLCAECRRVGISDDRVYHIGSPADTVQFYPVDAARKALLRANLGLSPEGPIIVFVGGVIRRKGTDLLPAIFSSVKDTFPGACLLLVGKWDWPPEMYPTAQFIRDELEEYVANGQLRFTGTVSNVQEYLQASDVFLFPSRREGLPHTPIEAMACGLPCVVREIEGITSAFVDDGVEGFVVRGDDAAAYATAIVRVLSNEMEYHRMSENAVRRVQSQFSADVVDSKYAEMYRNLLVAGCRIA